MSLKDDGHNRTPPKDRVDPDYPVHLTDRFCSVELSDSDDVVVYDKANENAWVQGFGLPRDSML